MWRNAGLEHVSLPKVAFCLLPYTKEALHLCCDNKLRAHPKVEMLQACLVPSDKDQGQTRFLVLSDLKSLVSVPSTLQAATVLTEMDQI